MNLKKVQKIDWLVLLLFTALAFLLRLPSFFEFGVSNSGDEGLYLLMARDFINGKPPYTGIWDNKPIGIYLFYSLALIIFGNSIIGIPVIASIAVSITSFLLYKLGQILDDKNNVTGIIAGILYAVFSVGTDELAANTELFFVPFTLFALYQLFQINLSHSTRSNLAKLFIIGLAMGIGLTIKQVVVFEFIGILILGFIILRFPRDNSNKYSFKDLLQSYILLLIGFIIPSALVVIYFLLSGHFGDYVYANFTANLLRVSNAELTIFSVLVGWLIQIKRNLLLGLGLLLAPLYVLTFRKHNSAENRNLSFLIIWAFFAFLGVSSPKSFFAHYFFQLLPPLCLLTAFLINKTVLIARRVSKISQFITLALILVVPMFNNLYPTLNLGGKYIYYRYVKGIENWGNTPAAIAKYLQQRVSKRDYIYVFNYYAVLYYLVPAKVPTKYAFSLFLTSSLSNIAGVNPQEEIDRIMAKKPTYIVVGKHEIEDVNLAKKMNNYLQRHYQLEKTFIDLEREIAEVEAQEVEVYRLRTSTALLYRRDILP